ncbi:hypothetical protein GCM10028820_20190 [Tessaracoccus terricola]
MTPELDHDKYSAYLNQHLVAADAGVQAFRAAADTWADTEWEATFRQLHDELEESHEKLKALIERLGYEISKLRNLVSGAAAVAGRLNPLNPTRNRDGLMTQPEFDALAAAIRGQQMMWETLGVLAEIDDRLDADDCRAMVDRCEDQRRRVLEVNAATAKSRFTVTPGDD